MYQFLRGDVGHHCRTKALEDPLHALFEHQVDAEQIEAEEHRREDHDDRRRVDLALRGPRDALHLVADFGEELAGALPPAQRRRAGPRSPCLFDRFGAHRQLLQLQRSVVASRRSSRIGRPGGNRTPNPRFWRPVLCQLSYWPTRLLRSAQSARYFCSLCGCASGRTRQYFFISSRSVVFFLFFVVL